MHLCQNLRLHSVDHFRTLWPGLLILLARCMIRALLLLENLWTYYEIRKYLIRTTTQHCISQKIDNIITMLCEANRVNTWQKANQLCNGKSLRSHNLCNWKDILRTLNEMLSYCAVYQKCNVSSICLSHNNEQNDYENTILLIRRTLNYFFLA